MVVLASCRFETPRLVVRPWTSITESEWRVVPLSTVVVDVMTPKVTATLPWPSISDSQHANEWIREQNEQENVTILLVVERQSESNVPENQKGGRHVGLMVLAEFPVENDSSLVEVRLGYMLRQSAWGRGLASDFVGGLVDWCHCSDDASKIHAVVGGVEKSNPASIRVLEKNGFVRVENANNEKDDSIMYILDVGSLRAESTTTN